MRIRSVLSFAFGTLISRVLGFVRELVFAYALGSTYYADAIVVAIRIPMMLRGMLAEGISQNAFVPVIVRWKDRELLWALIVIILSASMVAVLVGMVLSPMLIMIMAPGFIKDPEKFSFTRDAMLITFPSLFFISSVAIQTGVLNSRGRFFISGISPVFFNLGMIFVLLFAKNRPILGALAFLVGCIFQFLFLALFIKERPAKPNFKHKAIKEFFKNWLSLSLNTGFLQTSTLINTIIASFLPTGSLAYLNYAFRLVQLPQGLIGVSIGTVLSKEVSENEKRSMYNLQKSLKFSTVLSLLAVLFFAFFGEIIIDLLFVRGRFTHYDAHQTYMATLGYLTAIPSFVYSSVILSFLFAVFRRKDANLGLAISTIMNLLVAPILAKLMSFVGIALAVSISQGTSVIFWSYRIFGFRKWFFIITGVLAFSLVLCLVFIFTSL